MNSFNLPLRKFVATELLIRLLLILIVVQWGWGTFYNDVTHYFEQARDISWNHLPYRDFLWEYPPLAALILVLVPLTGRNDPIFHLVFVAMMVAIEYGTLLLLRRSKPEVFRAITEFWTLGVLPLMSIAYFRLDLIPMGFAAVAVVAMVHKRGYVLAVVAGFAAKLWPIVFAAAMVAQRRVRDAALAVAGCLAVVGAWYAFSPDGFRDFLDFRQGSGFQAESIPGSVLLFSGRDTDFLFGAIVVSDHGWTWVQVLMNVLLVGIPIVALAVAWVKRETVDLVAFIGFLVTVLLLSQRLLSPQFLVWLAPFVVWLWPAFKRQGYVFAVAAWLTVAVIQKYRLFVDGNELIVGMCVLRNLLLVWLAIEFARIAFCTPASASASANFRPNPQPSKASPVADKATLDAMLDDLSATC